MLPATTTAWAAILAVFGVTMAAAQFCFVSNGVVSLYDTPTLTQCVSRSDTSNSYIKEGGNIPSSFVYGALARPSNITVVLTFFTSDQCTGTNYSITCITLPNSVCQLDLSNNPFLLNVGPPTQCIKRVDTHTNVPVGPYYTIVQTVALGAPVQGDNCPISVSPMLHADCTSYLHSGPISCPCPPGCISTNDFSSTLPFTLAQAATTSEKFSLEVISILLTHTAEPSPTVGAIYYNAPVPYDAKRRSFAAYAHFQIDVIDNCGDSICNPYGGLVLQTTGPSANLNSDAYFPVYADYDPDSPATKLLSIGIYEICPYLYVVDSVNLKDREFLGCLASNTTADFFMWVNYNHPMKTLKVYLSQSGMTKPAMPTINLSNIDIDSTDFLGPNPYYVGFAGAMPGIDANDRVLLDSIAFCVCTDDQAATCSVQAL